MRAKEDRTELRYLEFDGEDAVKECLAAGLWEGAFRDPAPPFDLLDRIEENLRRGKPRHLSVASGCVRELLSICGEHARRSASDPSTHEARRLIHTQYGNPAWGIPELQKALGVGRTTLSARFKADTGESPHAYLLNLRVREACHLLRNTTLPVSTVALRCGFANAVYFSQLISKRTGRSPRAYRNGDHPSAPRG